MAESGGSEPPLDLAELARASFELAADAYYWISEDARFVLVNRAACETLGYSRETLLSMRVFDIDAVMTDEMWPAHWRELQERRHFAIESVHRRADGSIFPVEVSVNYVAFGKQFFNCAMIRDLTEQESQRRESERNAALKTATIDCALDCVISIDESGCIVEFNPAAEATFGYRRADVLGKPLREVVVPPDMRKAHDDGMRRYLDTGIGPALNQRLELTALHADGTQFPVEIAISPIKVGGRSMFTAYLRDITERKAAEKALTDARAAAERASQYKSRFLARMSHEIRTPLTAIVGYADLLTQPRRDETSSQQWGGRIQDNTRYLLSLVNDILDLSKIEAGEATARPVATDLVATIYEIDTMFRPRATEKLLEFDTEFATPVPTSARVDATKFKQIVVNLLTNAIKATTTGRVGMRVAVTPVGGDGNGNASCRVEVFDTGVGIPEAEQERLFQPFKQVEDDVHAPLGGTGLGLSICRQFARLLGGDVDFESEVGVGSTFVVQVPLTETSGYSDAAERRGSTGRPADGIPDLGGRRLLVVDDNPDNREILRYLLDPTAADIAVAEDGVRALEAIENANDAGMPFDIVLLDMQMPGLSGYSVVRALRTRGVTSRVVAVTAYATSDDREKCLAAGCDDYLTKPVEPAELYDRLATMSSRPRAPKPELDADPVFAQLRAGYVESLELRTAELHGALQKGDFAVIRRIAHQLKGTGANFSFPAISEIAARCEDAIVAGATGTAAVDDLIRCIEAAVADYRAN